MYKILVVDDTLAWRKVISKYLQRKGYLVFTAANSNDALTLLKEKKFDLVSLDMRLVDKYSDNIEGLSLLKVTKELQPFAKAIILTGYPDEEQRAKALGFYHADGFYEKAPDGEPFDIGHFGEIVQQLLSESN